MVPNWLFREKIGKLMHIYSKDQIMTETRNDMAATDTAVQYCQSCGAELAADSQFCESCGTEVGSSDSSSDHTALKLIGGTSAVISLIFLPIIFGPLSMLCGFLVYSKGDEQTGKRLAIGGFACMCVGMFLGFLFFASVM